MNPSEVPSVISLSFYTLLLLFVLEDARVFSEMLPLLLVFYIFANLVWCLSKDVSSLIVNGVRHASQLLHTPLLFP